MSGAVSPLTDLRGEFPAARLNARRVASMVEVPNCVRRTILDSAGVDTSLLVKKLGFKSDRQSPLAISRGAQFEALLARDGRAQLVQLARRHLGLELTDVREKDLSPGATRDQVRVPADIRRAKMTRQELNRILRKDPNALNLLVKPLTTLTIGELEAQLEQDVLAFAEKGSLHVVAIRNFYLKRDDADPTLVGKAARESAVHVLSLQRMAEEMGFSANQVSTKVLLILPRDLLFIPAGIVLDVSNEVQHLADAIDRVGNIEELAESLDLPPLPALPVDLQTDPDDEVLQNGIRGTLSALPMRFGDGCVSCALFRPCRDEADASRSTARMGSAVSALCGDDASVDELLDLAEGRREPQGPSESALSTILRRANAAVVRAQTAGAA